MTKVAATLQKLFSEHWKNIIKFILAIILFGFVLSQTSLKEIFTQLKNLPLSWLLIIFLLFTLHTMLKALQYWMLLKDDVDYPSVLRIIVFQNSIANLVSVAASVASYLAIFKTQQKVALKKSGTVFLTIKIGDMISIWVYTFISAYILWDQIDPLREIVTILLASILVGILFLWVAILLKERFYLVIKKLVTSTKLQKFTIIDKSLSYLEWISKQDHKKLLRIISTISLLSIIYLTVAMIYGYARVKMVNIPIDIWPVIFIISISQLLSYLPIHVFGGLGLNEVADLYLFGLFGMFTNFDLAAALISLRIVSYLFYLIMLGLYMIDASLSQKLRKQ